MPVPPAGHGEKEWGKWSGAANLFLIHEWGRDIEYEWEAGLIFGLDSASPDRTFRFALEFEF